MVSHYSTARILIPTVDSVRKVSPLRVFLAELTPDQVTELNGLFEVVDGIELDSSQFSHLAVESSINLAEVKKTSSGVADRIFQQPKVLHLPCDLDVDVEEHILTPCSLKLGPLGLTMEIDPLGDGQDGHACCSPEAVRLNGLLTILTRTDLLVWQLLMAAPEEVADTFESLLDSDWGHALGLLQNGVCFPNQPAWVGSPWIEFPIEALTRFLSHEDREVREAAIIALSSKKGPSAEGVA